MSQLVLSPNITNYRKLAQVHYGLTDDQLRVVDIHHNPPRCDGGRNIPEHLFIYHPTLHRAVHETDSLLWAHRSSGNKHGPRGKPPTKTRPTDMELSILRLRNQGWSRKQIATHYNITIHQVKRAVTECIKFGYKYTGKPGPQRGCPQRGGNSTGINQFT